MRRFGLRLSLFILIVGLLPAAPMSNGASEIGDFESSACRGGGGPNQAVGMPMCAPGNDGSLDNVSS